MEPTFDGLASVDPDRLADVQESAEQAATHGDPPVDVRYFPTVDDDLVPADPFDVIARGRAADVPLLVSATAQEAEMLAATQAAGIDQDKVDRRLRRLGLDDERAAAWRAANEGAEPWEVLGRALTASMFQSRALRLADAWSAARQPTWMASFDWRAPDYGAVHCLDVPFAFDVLDAPGVREVAGKKAPQSLADDLHAAFVRFVTEGDPGWARYDVEHRRTMVWDESSAVAEDPWRVMRSVWNPEDDAGPHQVPAAP